MKKTRKVRALIADHQGAQSGGDFHSWSGGRLTSSADIVETSRSLVYARLLKKKLNVLTAYSAFEEDLSEADIAGRLGVSITVLGAHPRDPLTAEFQSVMISITEIFGH